MLKIKIKLQKAYTNKLEVIQELIQADARYYNSRTDGYFNLMINDNHNNMLDILNYLEPDPPIVKDSEYVEKKI